MPNIDIGPLVAEMLGEAGAAIVEECQETFDLQVDVVLLLSYEGADSVSLVAVMDEARDAGRIERMLERGYEEVLKRQPDVIR